ncbi:hypothetical protein SMACR_07475 [Sordaria macrospora]|uniref:ABC transporter domain-containing protein n=1 Tax=Sordaria macrospora TaxID=5147 RepID=A0A8S8ZI63_SORMA|nr:hypothetical protein SMACR_07475 [Sordaria macrospora]WPJ65442.1 hypothetical protein SMAC4_07475 [Sordaria macrospora]
MAKDIPQEIPENVVDNLSTSSEIELFSMLDSSIRSGALQDPFFPVDAVNGPRFLDTQACLCQLRPEPVKGDTVWWQCVGNQFNITDIGGKWFQAKNVDGLNLDANSTLGPSYDASYPPDSSQGFEWDNTQQQLVITGGRTPGLSVWDTACTAENNTLFSTTLYRAAAEIQANQTPVNAAPCWRPGAVPVQIQDYEDWWGNGCKDGFLCSNNTVNSLPQFCPPVTECQLARLGGIACELSDANIGMGPFEPVVCQAGWYCPREEKGMVTLKCPSGHYCQAGAATPTPCAVGSRCPEGSQFERYLLPIVLLIVIDVLLILGMIYLGIRKRRRNASPGAIPQNSFASFIGGYKQVSEERHEEVDYEMALLRRTRRQDTFRGLGDQLYEQAPPLRRGKTVRHNPDPEISPTIRAFVDSMRKATSASEFGLSFGYNQLTFAPKNSKRPILQNVTGSINSGSLTAIMGGSGAGKSTFINVLMGKTQYTKGSVSVNNVPGKLKQYKKLIGYVPQDDIVLPELTVYENILHSAKIRLPRTWTKSDIETHVNAVIDCLELSHVRDSLVGSVGKPVISGGQRKRVSIGMELAAAPMAIFLDEPTSGLDATSASSIMSTLKALGRLGITVIVIIHQPRVEIFEMLDDMILLGNGQLIYEGPQSQAKTFFEQMGFVFPPGANCSDVITDIITGNGRPYKKDGDISKEALIAHWAKGPSVSVLADEDEDRTWQPAHSRNPSDTTLTASESSESDTPRHNRSSVMSLSKLKASARISILSISNPQLSGILKHRGAPRWRQTLLCLSRSILQQYRASSNFWFEMGLSALAGFLLGLAQQPKNGAFFRGQYNKPYDILSLSADYAAAPQMAMLITLAIGLSSAAPGVKVFSEEMLVYRREAEAGHSRVSYFFAKTISVLPRMTLACLHFSAPLFLVSVPVIPFWTAFLANLLYVYCIYGLASCMSMVVRREDAPLFATMISLIVGILSGAAPSLSKAKEWHVEWLWRAGPGVWLGELYFGQLVKPFGYLYDVQIASKVTGYDLDRLWVNMLVLLGIGTAYRLLAFVGLIGGGKMRV